MKKQHANDVVLEREAGTARGGQGDALTHSTTYNVYNQAYNGKTYSVKYLGIVDGTMGILSRKMAL